MSAAYSATPDPASAALEPLAEAWLEAIDRGGAVQWALPLEEMDAVLRAALAQEAA